jgi:glycosyltransferase involved in cell wall biosynthesis
MLKNDTSMISVIMPVYNSANYLPQAIKSILNQTYTNFEFIIIDDGSTDLSLQIIKKFAKIDERIVVIHNKKNLGICLSLNKGIKLAKGNYIARMDSDDWSYPNRLLKQFVFMKKHPEVSVCGGSIRVCDNNLKIKSIRHYPISDKKIRENIFKINPFAHPAVMYKKQSIIKAGGYNEKLFTVEDYDLYFRLGIEGKFANLTDIILKLRIRYDSISYSNVSRQTLLNLYVRLKAVVEYKYSWHLKDLGYFILGLIGVVIIPTRHKLGLYNLLRKYQK